LLVLYFNARSGPAPGPGPRPSEGPEPGPGPLWHYGVTHTPPTAY